jgi:hypothetical protein
MATMAIRMADPLAPKPFEVRNPTGIVCLVGKFDLEQIGDYDVSALVYRAEMNPGKWVEFPTYKPPKTYRPYR